MFIHGITTEIIKGREPCNKPGRHTHTHNTFTESPWPRRLLFTTCCTVGLSAREDNGNFVADTLNIFLDT